jgi:3-hydroxybutyrate dehydrogenase
MNLTNKLAVVTGAASGIGLEIARTFAQAGAKVAIADLNAEKARGAAGELTRAGHSAMGVAMDVTSEAGVDAGMDAIANAHGRIDVLVSNAGIQIVASAG